MIEDLKKLAEVLDTKVKPIVEAVEKADPLSEDYHKLLENFNATMAVASDVNRTLLAVANAKKSNEVKEEGEK